MARLNARVTLSTAPSSRFGSATPGPTSDQENRDPETGRRDKGKSHAMDPTQRSNLPTPTSDGSNSASRGQKRKRMADAPPAATQYSDSEEERFTRYFDPNQNADERRDIKRESRALDREFRETKNDLDGEGLTKTADNANKIFKRVKQTNDATIDSRLMAEVGDAGHKQIQKMVLGDSSTGIDVDEFLSKCINYMTKGAPGAADDDDAGPSRTQRRRMQRRADSDDEDDGGDMIGVVLDWEFLGRNACFPYNSRPPVPSFLLGPLSVEKKQRTQTQRRARQAKDSAGKEPRPEALSKNDLQQSDENGLTAICTRVRTHLRAHCKKAKDTIERAGFTDADAGTQRFRSTLRKCRVTDTGGPSLFDYVVNPHSFGQTVENLFYVSFLIKEGVFGIHNDGDGLPSILSTKASSLEDQRTQKISKHQAVFSIDFATWQQLIEAYDIREPMIPHRQEEQPTQMGARGWYN